MDRMVKLLIYVAIALAVAYLWVYFEAPTTIHFSIELP